jgi:triosephosphate isomerase
MSERLERRPLICGNWKMHCTVAEATALAADVRRLVASARQVDVAVAPPFTALHPVARRLEGSSVALAGQALHPAEQGAHTGEISAPMLAEVGCRHVIIGHSERRAAGAVDDAAVAARVRAALDAGLSPIVCVGEQLAERDAGRALERVGAQMRAALAPVAADEAEALVLAYEPVWAIGTGRTATPEQAQEVHAFIRGLLRDQFGAAPSGGLRILYGGSVKPGNMVALMAQNDVDGALVGGASLNAESFARIARFQSELENQG